MKFGDSPCGKFCSVIGSKRKFTKRRKINLGLLELLFGRNVDFVVAAAGGGA